MQKTISHPVNKICCVIAIFLLFLVMGNIKVYGASKTITVKYNNNTPAGTTTTGNVADTAITVPGTTSNRIAWDYPVNSDKAFRGWASSATPAPGDAILAPGYEVADDDPLITGLSDGGTLNLYAVWGDAYTIRFVTGIKNEDPDSIILHDGVKGDQTLDPRSYYMTVIDTGDSRLSTGIDIEFRDLPSWIENPAKVTRPGYTFSGWAVSENSTGYPASSDLNTANGLKFKVVGNDVTFISGTQQKTLTKSGGWGSKAVLYVVPVWKPNVLTLNYDLNGGTVSGNIPSANVNVTAGKSAEYGGTAAYNITDKTPQSGNLKFIGWTETRLGTDQAPENTPVHSSGSTLTRKDDSATSFTLYNILKDSDTTKTLYAYYENERYDIKFMGAEGSQSGITGEPFWITGIRLSDSVTFPANSFTATGYQFTDWLVGDIEYQPGDIKTLQEVVTAGQINLSSLPVNSDTGHKYLSAYATWVPYTYTYGDITYSITWNDGNDQDGKRPDSFSSVLTQYVNGTAMNTWSANTNETAKTLNFPNMPKQYLDTTTNTLMDTSYKLKVNNAPSGYAVNIKNSNFTGTGTIKFAHTPETVDVKLKINMDDGKNQDGARPRTITVTLKGSDGSEHKADVTIAGDSTDYTFTAMPKYSKGTEIKYELSVTSTVDGYKFDVTGNSTSYTVKGTYTPKKKDVTVTASFTDDNDALATRPASITVILASPAGNSTATLSKAGNYYAVVKDLPMYKDGSMLQYICTPSAIDGYTSAVTGNIDTGFSVVYTLTDAKKKEATEKMKSGSDTDVDKDQETKKAESEAITLKNITDIKVRTIWNDANATGSRPSSYKITLLGSDGYSQDAELSQANDYQAIFSQMPDKDDNSKEITYKLRVYAMKGYTTHIYKNKQDPTEFIVENFNPGQTNQDMIMLEQEKSDQDTSQYDEEKIKELMNEEPTEASLQASPSDEEQISNIPTWMIIGGSLAGIVLLAALAGLIVMNNGKKRKKR